MTPQKIDLVLRIDVFINNLFGGFFEGRGEGGILMTSMMFKSSTKSAKPVYAVQFSYIGPLPNSTCIVISSWY